MMRQLSERIELWEIHAVYAKGAKKYKALAAIGSIYTFLWFTVLGTIYVMVRSTL